MCRNDRGGRGGNPLVNRLGFDGVTHTHTGQGASCAPHTYTELAAAPWTTSHIRTQPASHQPSSCRLDEIGHVTEAALLVGLCQLLPDAVVAAALLTGRCDVEQLLCLVEGNLCVLRWRVRVWRHTTVG